MDAVNSVERKYWIFFYEIIDNLLSNSAVRFSHIKKNETFWPTELRELWRAFYM
jgi:hypothetical protein